jgi:hypothetical protein
MIARNDARRNNPNPSLQVPGAAATRGDAARLQQAAQASPVMNMVMTIVIITSDQSSPKSFITIILVMKYRPNHS